jgi:hypothetical protein
MIFLLQQRAHCALRFGGLSCYDSLFCGAAYGQVLEKKA